MPAPPPPEGCHAAEPPSPQIFLYYDISDNTIANALRRQYFCLSEHGGFSFFFPSFHFLRFSFALLFCHTHRCHADADEAPEEQHNAVIKPEVIRQPLQ